MLHERYEPTFATSSRLLIDAFAAAAVLPDVSLSVGTVAGRVHTLEKGKLSMTTPVLLASSSKYPAAVAIAGAVQDGHIAFETRVHTVFPWWTRDPTDSRANVTLRHLLTFTSGLISLGDAGGCNISCLNVSGASNASKVQPEDCAKEIYASDMWLAKGPGSVLGLQPPRLPILCA
jgi:CubicO group peptidase (beta-lactamase class C family)